MKMRFSQVERDAYQIAENTPSDRHSKECKALGVGALVSEISSDKLCSCIILELTTEIATKINES